MILTMLKGYFASDNEMTEQFFFSEMTNLTRVNPIAGFCYECNEFPSADIFVYYIIHLMIPTSATNLSIISTPNFYISEKKSRTTFENSEIYETNNMDFISIQNKKRGMLKFISNNLFSSRIVSCIYFSFYQNR